MAKKITKAVARKRADLLTPERLTELAQRVTSAAINHENTEARMNQDLDRVRQKYGETLGALALSVADGMQVLEAWALAHKELFQGLRNIDLVYGKLSIRMGQPQVKACRGWSLAKSVTALKRKAWGAKYMRPREPELNKDALLEDRKRLSESQLKGIGLKVVQDDTAAYEPLIERHQGVEAA